MPSRTARFIRTVPEAIKARKEKIMKLSDLYPVISDSMTLNIYNPDGDLISKYDGRNGIAECLNDCQVESVYPPMENTLNVFVYTNIDEFI